MSFCEKEGAAIDDQDLEELGRLIAPAIVKETQKMLADLDIQQLERDALEGPLFGFQPIEVVWGVSAGPRKFLFPERLTAKPQEWFFYDAEGTLQFRKPGQIKGTPPPPFKIINVRYESSYQNPYGHALLSKCYWPVTFKNGGLRFWVNFMEKYGMPFLIGQYTRGASFKESQKLADDLANMTEDSVIVIPSDIEIELQEASRTSSVDLYKELIKNCNAEISKAILSQTLTTELDMGSYAASMTHFKVRREVILADTRLVERAMNTLIKYIVDLNFGGSAYPKFKIIVNDAENMQKVDRDVKLARAGGVKFTKKYWMNSYGFDEDEIEVEEK